ncbi:MAG: hypothetical protein WCJ30_01885 [Deltaproteobacteria bacterium]
MRDEHFVLDATAYEDTRRWLRSIELTPPGVAQHLEFAHHLGIDRIAEVALADVMTDTERGFPSRRPSGSLPWCLPRWGCTARQDHRFVAHVVAALSLATRSDSPSARRIRRLRNLDFESRVPWWLQDSLERFELLETLECRAPWHPEARFPSRMLCLPAARTVSLTAAALGDARLAACEWDLPRIETLRLAGNGLTEVPDAIAALSTLECLDLSCNPIRTLPAFVADLPRLHTLDLRGTRITRLPSHLPAHPDFEVRMPS